MSERRPLPQRRPCVTYTESFWGQPWHVSLSFYDDNTVGEIFISASKTPGSALDAVCRDLAIAVSLALQHGTPMAALRSALTKEANGAPSTIMGAILDKLDVTA